MPHGPTPIRANKSRMRFSTSDIRPAGGLSLVPLAFPTPKSPDQYASHLRPPHPVAAAWRLAQLTPSMAVARGDLRNDEQSEKRRQDLSEGWLAAPRPSPRTRLAPAKWLVLRFRPYPRPARQEARGSDTPRPGLAPHMDQTANRAPCAWAPIRRRLGEGLWANLTAGRNNRSGRAPKGRTKGIAAPKRGAKPRRDRSVEYGPTGVPFSNSLSLPHGQKPVHL